ncbi:MAG: hypothetical protein H6819_06525 [Phycisphaerales bacterium]|nr:hypothetical protein [Phycisphaerales bacterium]MCB9855235.1 hypothetical protein [Phycisphaerales bacterium]MCB9862828.1 hypothetical protein [Phycisphaerales bacterium]
MNRRRPPFLIVGLIGLLVFTATGFYLMIVLDSKTDMSPAVRLTHRANHVYILFAALINLAAVGGAAPPASGLRRILYRIGATLVLLSPLLTTLAFLIERSNVSPMRIWTMTAIFATSFGVFALAAGRVDPTIPHSDAPTN